MAVIVAASVWFNGADASGVSASVSVCDAPRASVSVDRLLAARSLGVATVSVTVSETFPLFTTVSVAVAATPGELLSDVGVLVIETLSTAGMANVSVRVWVIDEVVELVAVTVNESWVPGGGSGWPVFGTR